jgi:hypothetical protein
MCTQDGNYTECSLDRSAICIYVSKSSENLQACAHACTHTS